MEGNASTYYVYTTVAVVLPVRGKGGGSERGGGREEKWRIGRVNEWRLSAYAIGVMLVDDGGGRLPWIFNLF